MLLTKNIKNDIRAAQKIRLPWWAVLLIGVASLPLYWLFDHFGKDNLGFPAAIAIGMLAFVAAAKWDLRRKPWFWGTMTVFAALHGLLIAFVPWGDQWVPAVAIAVIGSLDVVVMITVLSVVRRFLGQ